MPPPNGPPQQQYMRQQQGPPRPMGGPGPNGMYPPPHGGMGGQMGGQMGPPMGGNYPPNMRPPPNMAPMGGPMSKNGPPRPMGGPMPMGGPIPMGGPMPMGGQMPMGQRPMGQRPMGGPMGGPMMGRPGPPPNMGGPPRPNGGNPGYRPGPPPGQGPGMGMGPGMGSGIGPGGMGAGPGQGPGPLPSSTAHLSIYGGMGSPSASPTPSANSHAPSPMAPIPYQPKTSHAPSPTARPALTSTPIVLPVSHGSGPGSGSGSTVSPSPTPVPPRPLRRENSSSNVRKDSPQSSAGRNLNIDASSNPSQVRNEIATPLPSPGIRKDTSPIPSPKPPVRRDTASSLKSQKESSPMPRTVAPVPQRKETPPQPLQPQQPMRKNLISMSSPSPSATGRLPDVTERRPVVEIGQFAKEGFNHEEYLTQNLANASEETVRSFLQSLKDSKSMAAEDLQENVFKNYNEFVTISKEISKLESDMQTLRGLLDDLKTASDNLVDDDDEFLLTAGIEDSAPVVPKRMTVMVSSMSDLTSAWKAQMMALWEGIEGAQKMLPYHPKRHLIRESPSFVEVNTLTNKIKHPVHIVLMNDTILIATRKKKTAAHSKYKLLGDRCWPLTEITIEDMKDTAEIRNAIKITHGSEVFVYKTEKGQEKQTMLVNAKRTTDEMLAKASDSRNKGMFGFAPAMPSRAGMRFRTSIGHNQAESRWLAEFTDDLDVLIAQREFDGAVASIEKATVMLSQLTLPAGKMEDTRKRLDERISRLSRAIIVDLGHTHITNAAIQRNVAWLERLGCLDQARDVFLSNRTKVNRTRMSQVKAKRDPTVHIEELAMIVFTTIKNTSEWFELAFVDPKMTSALVKWAKQEIEYFADIYKDIVFGNQRQSNFQVIADCFKVAQEHCNMLTDVGLDLAFVLEGVLLPYLTETIADHESRCLDRMDAIIEHDDFAAMSGEELGSATPLSASMIAFYTVMLQFVNNICLIGSLTLYSRIVDSVAILFKAYVNRTIQVYEEKGMTDDQFISESFISRVIVQLRHRFDRPIPELEAVREELGGVELGDVEP
ncbi:exocyst complex component exo84 [Mortierella sp. GBA30]|nr:exocyst complex component exo84 [Mortierella sp. GBA30]